MLPKPQHRDFAKIKNERLKRKRAIERDAEKAASGRKTLQVGLGKMWRIRFLKRKSLQKDLAEAHRKAAASNIDAKLETAINRFDATTNAALTAFENACHGLNTAISTGQPRHVVEKRNNEFIAAEQKYREALEKAETNAKNEIQKIIQEYAKA